MYFLIAGRQQGKTMAMIEWMRQAPEGVLRVCVCISEMEAKRLSRAYPEFEPQFISFTTLLDRRGYHNPQVELGIDNADLILQVLFNNDIGLVTATGVVVSEPVEQ